MWCVETHDVMQYVCGHMMWCMYRFNMLLLPSLPTTVEDSDNPVMVAVNLVKTGMSWQAGFAASMTLVENCHSPY